MKYPLDNLLKVRELRETLALNRVSEKKRAIRRAAERVDQQHKTLLSYQQERKHKEQHLYDEVREKNLPYPELNHFYMKLQWMQTCEIAHHKALRDAQEALSEAREQLRQAQDVYRTVMKKKEKIIAHRGIWQTSQNKLASRQVDLAADDFQTFKAGSA